MFTKAYGRYAVGTLTACYTLSVLDQSLIFLVLQSIGEDLRLSDTQLGCLSGIVFGILYSTLGIPFGRWADRGNRATIASLAIGLWGVGVMLTLFVGGFVQLVLARMAAAIGGSGVMPATYSLVGDYSPEPAQRTRAMSIYMLANPLSLLISYGFGGWANERYGWKMTFLLIGLPALLMAALVKLTIREPRAQGAATGATQAAEPPLSAVLMTLWRQATTRHLVAGLLLVYVLAYAVSPWYAAFLARSHQMHTSSLGVWLGLIFGLGGTTGVWLGGYAANRWFARNERGQLGLIALVLASQFPFLAIFLLLPWPVPTLIALIPVTISGNFFLGPSFALLQRLVADETRATTVAATMLLLNLIGMGVGPPSVGLLSDALKPLLGSDSLRFAMLAIAVSALWAGYHFWRASQSVGEALGSSSTDKDREVLVGHQV